MGRRDRAPVTVGCGAQGTRGGTGRGEDRQGVRAGHGDGASRWGWVGVGWAIADLLKMG